MNTFKVTPRDHAPMPLTNLDKAGQQMQLLVKSLTSQDSEIRYTGTADRPSLEVRVVQARVAVLGVDLGDQATKLLQLFASAVFTYREKAPSVLGDITTAWHSVDLPEDTGAAFDGNTLYINSKLGGASRMRTLRNVVLAAERVAIKGLTVPSAPQGQTWADRLRSELREGKTLSDLTGAIVAHSERPGEIRLATGGRGTRIVAASHEVQQLMTGFVSDRAGVATVRTDHDPLFGDIRYTLQNWAWLDS